MHAARGISERPSARVVLLLALAITGGCTSDSSTSDSSTSDSSTSGGTDSGALGPEWMDGGPDSAVPVTGAAYPDRALDTNRIEREPGTAEAVALLEGPDEPFVMTNLLVFREQAVGADFEGLTGAEAYTLYGQGMGELQRELGNRMVWNGDVLGQVVGESAPVFDAVAFVEYASPRSFVEFGARGSGDAADARPAGLLGQWLVPTRLLEASDPGQVVPEIAPPDERDLARSGLSGAQQDDLRAAADVAPIYLVELLAYSDGPAGAVAAPHRAAWADAVVARGGAIVLRGALQAWMLGEASPAFHEVVVSVAPGARALASALADSAVIGQSEARVEGLAMHWIYVAADTGIPLDF